MIGNTPHKIFMEPENTPLEKENHLNRTVIFSFKIHDHDKHFMTHTIHVWYIYLHLVDFYGKCR